MVLKNIQKRITSTSTNFFRKIQIPKNVFRLDPVRWKKEERYLKMCRIAKSIRVLTDTAKKVIKIFE